MCVFYPLSTEITDAAESSESKLKHSKPENIKRLNKMRAFKLSLLCNDPGSVMFLCMFCKTNFLLGGK